MFLFNQVKAIFNSNDDAFIQGVLIIVQFAEYVGSATRKVPLRGKMQLSRSRIFFRRHDMYQHPVQEQDRPKPRECGCVWDGTGWMDFII